MRKALHLRHSIGCAMLLLGVAALPACGSMDTSGFSGDVHLLLSRGAAYGTYLVNRRPADLSDAEVVALGYMERARLGLGSPYRLIDYALEDPLLPPTVRERLAYALLAQIVQGRIYEIEPAALDLVGLAGASGARFGAQQMQLIEREIASAPTATSGERAVRLGYRLAEAERSVTGVPQSVVAHVAALVSDRRRAREDAGLLLRTATAEGDDPLRLLQEWRRELRFRVESPALMPVSVTEEEAEARDGPQVALALRVLAQRLSAPTTLVTSESPEAPAVRRTYLPSEVAERLLEIARERGYPPQAPIASAVAINADALLGRPGLEPWQIQERERFTEEAWNEERLVAAAQILRGSGAGYGPRLPLIELQSATFLRSWNQEDPWFPGDPAPAARDLEARFGLASIDFSTDVPEEWRPYYLRMLGRGLHDLQRVIPTASVRGLRIRIGRLPHDMRALALHEPRTRTLFLPPHTGAGTLAHEIAHDLDWQLARSRYGTRGAYATDLAVRAQRGDRIATSMTGLAAALNRPASADSPPSPHETRPAEIFARGADWLVAALLAREGRAGGYLTSFQDAALTGYGTTRGPDVGGGAVPALLAILDGVAPVMDRNREWALDAHGPARTLSPGELAGAILDAGYDLPTAHRLASISDARDRSLASVAGISCRLSSAEGMRRLTAAQRGLVGASTSAAARGAAIDGVRALGESQLGPTAAAAVYRWIQWRLYGAPEPVDSAVTELAPAFEDLLLQARLLEESVPEEESIFSPTSAANLCGGNPFARALLRPSARLSGEPAPLLRPISAPSDSAREAQHLPRRPG